jgi:cytochrome c556
VKELEEIESEQPIDAELSDITERTQGPKIKNSKDASISILSGNGNPDPVQDATWQEWLDWKARADKQGIDLSKVERNATTEGDLRMYLMEIAPGVADAEEQASITE